jgi:N-methylhydantoinase A
MRFHRQHDKLYGYCLAEEGTPVELINLRLICTGRTRKPEFKTEDYDGSEPTRAHKSGSEPTRAHKRTRKVFLPLQREFKDLDIFDGAKLKYGNQVVGPAIIEQLNTTIFVIPEYNVLVDKYGSFTMYVKAKEHELEKRILM